MLFPLHDSVTNATGYITSQETTHRLHSEINDDIKKGSIINVGATHIRVVANILFLQ